MQQVGTKITYTGTLVVVGACSECGSNSAIPKRLYDDARQNGKQFFCSSCGSSQVYTKTENTKLREEAERARKDAEWWRKDAEREARNAQVARLRERAQKAAKTRLKNRIANGVCPCCKRHFANVEKHIKGQHPEYASVHDGGDDNA